MRRPMIDPSLSNEEKIKKLSIIVERLGRRSKTTAKAMVTPYPISNCVVGEDVKGEILRYMFLDRGSIRKGRVYLDRRLKEGAAIVITLENDIGSSAKSYSITRQSMIFEPNIEVFAGDRLTISIHPVDPEDKINEAWIGFKWIPSVEETVVHQVLIDELDKIDVSEE